MLNIAVASDLHVGSKARAHDLCPEGNATATDTDYLGKFEQFVDKRGVKADFLVVPGDLSNAAHPNEFALAGDIVSSLGAALNVGKRRVLFVPGNHDVDWEVLKLGPKDRTGLRLRQRYDPIRQTRTVIRWMGNRVSSSLEEPYCASWAFQTLIAIGLNTAWHDDPEIGTHFGSVHEGALERAEQELAKYDVDDERVRVLLVHHHPVSYKDPIPGEPDFSVMKEADTLLRFAHKHKFDLLIHGHRHSPNVSIRNIDGGPPLVVLGAGSFSAQLDARWNGLVSNQFHVICIDDRDHDTRAIRGHVDTWAFLSGGGWRESESANGLVHRWAFGTNWSTDQLQQRLKHATAQVLNVRSYVTFDDLTKILPELAYVPDHRLEEALISIAPALGCRRFGRGREDLVLVR